MITFFLLGIEEFGLQIEEPFSLLALETFCDSSIDETVIDMVIDEDEMRLRESIAKKRRGGIQPAPREGSSRVEAAE